MSELPTWVRDALTDQAKRKILSENLLRLHGLDTAETKARLVSKD